VAVSFCEGASAKKLFKGIQSMCFREREAIVGGPQKKKKKFLLKTAL
jgi:hypothetical protein